MATQSTAAALLPLVFLIVLLLMWTGELHVTPLTGILQMRPSFSYLDKADSKTREREAANEGVFNLHLFQMWEING